MDIYQTCLDEIALEGLDGITVSTLWLRLNQREETISVKLSTTVQEILWKFLLQHLSIEFYQIPSDRCDPIIFNRYMGIDVTTGKHIAIAPDELDLLQEVYYVKPVTTQPNIKGSCSEFESRINITSQLREKNLSLSNAINSFGEQRLVIVASQSMREGVLRGPGITSQTVENLTEIEYCILERIGRSRWQGEIQTVLNNNVFKQLKSAHIHYMMKSLFQKGLVTKQPYSYVRDDKGGKVYQQILLHLPHFKTDARSVSDIRAETVCEMLKQSETRSISCNDLRQILSVEGKVFRKLSTKMIAAGYVKVESVGSSKHADKIMTLIKTPSEKQEEEILDDTLDESTENDGEPVGLIAELPLTLQGFRHIFSTGENGCSQAMLHRRLKGYGSLEARHLCRKVEKAKIVKIIMIDHGKQRTQKYIAENFARNSSHTKEFFKEKKKMQKIMETSDISLHGDSSVLNASEVAETTADDSLLADGRSSESADVTNANHDVVGLNSSTVDSSISEANLDNSISRPDNEGMEIDAPDPLVKRSKWDTHQTTRKMKRTNTILTFINEQKVVEGFFALQKILQAEEKDEGLTTKVCKKTVKRLVQKLHNDSLIKYFSVPITSNDCTTDVDFVMSLDCDPLRLKTAIEQAQFKKYAEDSKKIAAEQADVIDLTGPSIGMAAGFQGGMNLTDVVKVEDCKPNSKLQYGYQPKFLRNQIVHEYLWYLAYGHPHNDKENFEMLDYDKVKEYSGEKNWKRFLPPAPSHPDFGPGWLQVGDAAVLLPLSILCQFHQYPYKIDGLEQYVNNSTQKNTLVRHLPLKMRGLIFYRRKYLLSLIQVIECLCFMGLVTFNKQNKNVNIRTKKEFEMIYVHRNVSMLDTRRSEKGYSEITEGVDYEQLRFNFDRFSDVERYWLKLRDICLMTPLGVRSSEEAEPEAGARHTVKLKVFIAEHVSRDDRDPIDDGSIPGDHRGAGGLDSSLFAHLYRNWFRTMKIVKNTDRDGGGENLSRNKPVRLPKLRPTVLHLTEEGAKRSRKKAKCGENSGKQQTSGKRSLNQDTTNSSKKQKMDDASDHGDVVLINEKKKANQDSNSFGYKVVIESNIRRNEKVKGGRGQKRTSSAETQPVAKKRRSKRTRPLRRKKEKYIDLLDKQARMNMNGKLRVSFSSAEDEILLMCKVTSTLIFKSIKIKYKIERHNVVSGLLIRDILYKHCKESTDKTSSSCLRRIRMLMKIKSARICHDINAAEILEDDECSAKLFESVRDKSFLEKPEEIEPLYLVVFDEVFRRFRDSPVRTEVVLPDTTEELHKLYTMKVYSLNKETRRRVVDEITSLRDILLATLENLIYVTLSLNEDEFSQYQAFNLFSSYPKELMHEVWESIKLSGIICKKPDMYLNRLRHLPFAVPRYHLSKTHFQSLQTAPLWKIFSELLQTTKELGRKKKVICDKNAISGPVIIINMLMLNKGDYFNLKFSPLPETSQRERPSSSSNEQETIQADDISDDDESQDKRPTTKNELFKLYRRKRFSSEIRDRHKVITPVVVECDDCDFLTEKAFADDVSKAVAQLNSFKCTKTSSVISIDDDDCDNGVSSSTLDEIKQKNSDSMNKLIDRVMDVVKEGGLIGVPLSDLKYQLCSDWLESPQLIDSCVELLSDHQLICVVGMWKKRAVLTRFAGQWFVTGTVFKGDRKLLVKEIRKELSQSNSKYSQSKKKPNPAGHKWDSEVYAVFKNAITIESDEEKNSNKNSATSSNPPSVTDKSSVNSPAVNEAVTSTCVLSDASCYSHVKFLCRPWHNVSGEVNYRTAKLLLTAVFVQVLWNPGITLHRLTKRFIGVMQRIVLIELLEKLASFKCVERATCTRLKPWELFTPLKIDPSSSVTSRDDDYYRVTCDGMLRMTFLCRELERLQSTKDVSFSLSNNSAETESSSQVV